MKSKDGSIDIDAPNFSGDGTIWYMQEDAIGGIIIAAMDNLGYLPANSNEVVNLRYLLNNNIDKPKLSVTTMMLDLDNHLWLGTTQDGVIKVDWRSPDRPFTKDEIKHYTHDFREPTSLTGNAVLYLLEGSRGDLWVCTDNGLNIYNEAEDNWSRFTRSDGIKNDKILAGAEDSLGRIWWSTISHGLLAWDPVEFMGTSYGSSDGLYHDAFLQHASHITEEDIMLFANEKGVQIFDPLKISLTVYQLPPIYFTGLKLNNTEIEISENGILTCAPEYTSSLALSHDQNNLSFLFCHSTF